MRSSMVGVVTPGASRLRLSHSMAICRPTSSQSPRCERVAHRDRGVADPLEAVEDVAVAVDVPLGDLPVVRAGIAAARRCRRARCGARARAGSTSSATRRDAVDAELDRRDAAVQRRPIVLHAGRHADRLALDVHRDLQEMLGVVGRCRSSAPARRTTAIVSADEPAMPAPAGDSPRVVSVAFSSR